MGAAAAGPPPPASPLGSAAPEILLPVGRRLRGFPGRRPGGRGRVPARPPGSVPRPVWAGFLPNPLFGRARVPDPVSVLAGVAAPPPVPVPVPVPPLAPVSLRAPVPGSVPRSLGVAVSVRARLEVWVSRSRPGPGLASPRRIFHGPIPRPRPGATRGRQSTREFPGQVASLGGGADGTVTCAHAH